MKEILNRYESYLNTLNKSENTIKNYMCDLHKFASYFIEKNIKDITTSDLMDYVAYLKNNKGRTKKKISATSINRKISSLKAFYNWCLDCDIIEKNNMERIKFISVQKNKEVVYMNLEQSKEFMKTVHNEEKKVRCVEFAKLRDEWIMLTYLQTGLRATELINIKLDDINTKEKTIRVVGKGDKIRYVALNDDNLELYERYLHERSKIKVIDDEYVVLNTRGKKISYDGILKLVKKYANESEIDDKLKSSITPHKLRHSYASNMFKANVNPKIISQSMGHSSLSTTMGLYVHVAQEDVLNTTRDVSNIMNGY